MEHGIDAPESDNEPHPTPTTTQQFELMHVREFAIFELKCSGRESKSTIAITFYNLEVKTLAHCYEKMSCVCLKQLST